MNVLFEKYIRNTLEAKEFKTAFEYLFSIIEEKQTELQSNAYVKTASLWWIKMWELFYGIPADDTLTLEERRAQVLLVKMSNPPYTKNTVIQQIRAITGVDTEITEDELNLHFIIDLTDVSKFFINLVHRYMRKVKPTNVTYSISVTPQNLDDKYQYYMAVSITQFIDVV